MNWLLNFLITWLSIDVVLIATGWYANKVVRAYFPNWWKQVIWDDPPDTSSELAEVTQSPPTMPSPEFH